MSILKGKKITLIVTASIAAYKACELLRLIKREGADVWVVMTEAATHFVGPLTFETLSGHPVAVDTLNGSLSHIRLAQTCDAILVAPATANTLAKAAQGIADNLATSTLLARTAPLLVAPAMNSAMWENPATQRNVKRLREDGVIFAGPETGALACGSSGAGRMVEPQCILANLKKVLTKPVLQGRHILLTSGPTYEAIDPVRGLTNRSSGKQGHALARALFEAGADVTLVTGPTSLSAIEGVKTIAVRSACEMLEAVQGNLSGKDAFIGVAAVADWRVAVAAPEKLKKHGNLTLTFEENPDILKSVSFATNRPHVVIGFAAETESLLEHAREKLTAKRLDAIVVNDARRALENDTTTVCIIEKDQTETLQDVDKATVAEHLVRHLARLLE